MVNVLKEFWNWVTGKQEVPPYPIPSGIITYSPEALDEGVEDNQNKIIILHDFDKVGKIRQKVFPYSVSRLLVIENEMHIPVFDKTEKKELFPIFNRALPQEASYLTR